MSGLAAHGLSLTRNGTAILTGVSLALGAAGTIAVIGPNGAGKSSLLRLLAGVTAPSAGTVRLDGGELARLSGRERARRIGYLPQQFEPHWNLSVDELVRLGAERSGAASPSAIEQALGQFELTGLRARRWSTLSGGERARVLLAMVLAVDPPVLIADEPGASLDIRHRLALTQMLAARSRERLCVVAMHDLDLAFRFFDRVILIDRGRVAADAPAEKLYGQTILDTVFGVRFMRVQQDGARLLHVHSEAVSQ